MTRFVTLGFVLAYHAELMALQGQQSVLMGDQATAKLEAALSRSRVSAFGEDAFPLLSEKAAALLQAILAAHAFPDGNKRAGVGIMLAFLELNGVTQAADQELLYELTIDVTTGKIREVSEIAARLRSLFAGLE